MQQKITEVELTAVKAKFQALVDDLVKAGLKDSKGVPAKRKVIVYALKRIGAPDTSVVSNIQWDKFFRQTDELRFDFVGLARYIGSLPLPVPAEPVAPMVTVPAFSLADLEMLDDAGISGQADSRPQVRYWKDRV